MLLLVLETLDEEGKETRNPHPWRAPRKAPSKGDSSHVCSSNARFPAFNLLIFVFVEIRRVPLVSFTNGREALRSIQCSNALRSMLVHDFLHSTTFLSTAQYMSSYPLPSSCVALASNLARQVGAGGLETLLLCSAGDAKTTSAA